MVAHRATIADERPQGPALGTALDPVCGMTVTIKSTSLVAEHAGHAYYFCGAKCRAKFVADPQLYLAPQPRVVVNAAVGTAGRWTCPMHAEIIRAVPGACPI